MPVNLDGQTRTGETIELDDGSFIGATLKGCTLIYRGGGLPNFQALTLDGCSWTLSDAAHRTLLMLHIMEESGKGMLQQMLDASKKSLEDGKVAMPRH